MKLTSTKSIRLLFFIACSVFFLSAKNSDAQWSRGTASGAWTGTITFDGPNEAQVKLNRAKLIEDEARNKQGRVSAINFVTNTGDTVIHESTNDNATNIGNQTVTAIDGSGNEVQVSTGQTVSNTGQGAQVTDGRYGTATGGGNSGTGNGR